MAKPEECRVLVIDDSKTMRRIVKRIVETMGFAEVDEADNGETALEMLRRKDYDLAVADWNMPCMTGIDLLREVRGDESLRNIPFVMVTAEGQAHNILEAVRMDVSQFVTKPFSEEMLMRKIRSALSRPRPSRPLS